MSPQASFKNFYSPPKSTKIGFNNENVVLVESEDQIKIQSLKSSTKLLPTFVLNQLGQDGVHD